MYVTSLIFYELDQQVKNPLRIQNVFKNKNKFKKTIFPAFKKLLNKQYFLSNKTSYEYTRLIKKLKKSTVFSVK